MRRRVRTAAGERTVRFASYAFDRETGELSRDGAPIPLRPQATRVLEQLLDERPGLVSRSALRRALWDVRAVEWETGLHQVVRQLRRALGDDPRRPRFIQTVPRRGYRFIAETASADRPGRTARSPWRDAAMWLLGVVSLPAFLSALCLLAGR